ncbi:MAG: hypothetical protein ACR650_12705 [Methylocystis sp.]
MSVRHSSGPALQLDENMTRASPITSAGSNLSENLLTSSEGRASENISYALHFKEGAESAMGNEVTLSLSQTEAAELLRVLQLLSETLSDIRQPLARPSQPKIDIKVGQ